MWNIINKNELQYSDYVADQLEIIVVEEGCGMSSECNLGMKT